MKYVYLVLSIIGIAATWYFNIQFYGSAADTSIGNFIALANANFPAKSISADISVVAVTFLIWMYLEAKRLEMKYWWILIPLTFLIAIAFTFPLFLYFREVALKRRKAITS